MAGKLRITGGRLLRRLFEVPKAADQGFVRPSSDRVREAIFSSLGGTIDGALVLDLFAGSGAYGFEAISRGAESVVMIEKNRDVAHCIMNNVRDLGLVDECEVLVEDATRFVLGKVSDDYDLIFVDPPYSFQLEEEFWRQLLPWVAPTGLIIFRCKDKLSFELPDDYQIAREKTYGGTYVVFLEPKLNEE